MAWTVRTNGGCGSRVGGSLFGLVFAGFGAFFCVLMGRTMLPPFAAWLWPAADCTIEASESLEGDAAHEAADGSSGRTDQPFRFGVRYRYDWRGTAHEGTVYRPGYHGGTDPSDVERLVARFPVGARVRCYVDPQAPAHAVLARPPLTMLLVFLVPLLFVGVGLLFASLPWWRTRGGPSYAGGVAPLGRPDPGRARTFGCGAAALGVFVLFGLAFFVPFFGLPVWRILQARHWTAVPCTIEASGVGSHSSSDGGPTYSVDVVYRYTVAGREHKGTRYDFVSGSSSGRDGKEAAVAALPPGTVTQCWVDPEDPTNAVLVRSFVPTMWFGLIPLVFVAVGLGGIALLARSVFGRAPRGVAQWLPGVATPGEPAAAAGSSLGMTGALRMAGASVEPSRTLQPKQSPAGKVGCAVVLAILVSGLIGTFVWKGVIETWRAGERPDGCLMVFLVPFVLIALGLLANVPYQILAFFNPRPRLELLPAVLRPGGRGRLRWQFSGLAGRLRRVEIVLEGSEEATHRVGTTTRTDTATFLRLTVLSTERAAEIAAGGEAAIDLPPDVVHSFSAPHNKIRYKLKLQGTVARWPDVADEFEIDVVPEGS